MSILDNRKAQLQHGGEVRRIFGVNLTHPYWNNITGLDVIALDDLVGDESKAGKSMRDVIQRKYGDRAVQLVEVLIGG